MYISVFYFSVINLTQVTQQVFLFLQEVYVETEQQHFKVSSFPEKCLRTNDNSLEKYKFNVTNKIIFKKLKTTKLFQCFL
jgi:hypothetical protein